MKILLALLLAFFHNQLGYVAFSNTGPGTRSTQVYINLRDNSALNDSEPAFAPFGKVIEGWDAVEKLHGGYGENSGSGMRAGHQDKLFEGGNAYMDKEFPKLDRLIRAAIISDKLGPIHTLAGRADSMRCRARWAEVDVLRGRFVQQRDGNHTSV